MEFRVNPGDFAKSSGIKIPKLRNTGVPAIKFRDENPERKNSSFLRLEIFRDFKILIRNPGIFRDF